LTAVVPAENVSTAGTVNVTVVNPTPGGGSSNSVPFTIIEPTFNPVFTALPVAGNTSPINVVTADFNHDGIADLAVIDAAAGSCNYQYYGTASVAIFLGNGNGTFTKHSTLCFDDLLGDTPTTLALAGDLNRDGNVDLAVVSVIADQDHLLNVYFGNGDGTFTGPEGVDEDGNISSIALGDFDNNGQLDVAASEQDSVVGMTNVAFYSFVPPFSDGGVSDSVDYFAILSPLVAGDFNGDGLLDLLAGDNLFLNAGNGEFAQLTNVPIGEVAGDFNGDGILDLASGGSVLLGNGDGSFTQKTTSTGPVSFAADLNGDGILDLVGGSSISLGNGDGTFQAPINSLAGFVALAAADFNNDGRMDLVGISGSTVTVLLQAMPTCGNPSQNAPNSGTYNVPPTTLPLVITWTNTTPSCVLHYTTDGSAPTASSPTYPSGGVSIYETTTVRVIAAAAGYNSSTIVGGKWTLNGTPAATPTFSPVSQYTGPATTVTISDSTASHTITSCTSNTGGCAPTNTGTTSIGFGSSGPTYICAFANATGYTQSATACWMGTYAMPTCGNPSQTSPYSGTYNVPSTTLPLVIKWTNPTSSCVLHYTTDGSAPTASSPTYPAGGLSIDSTTEIRVIAAASGYNSSSIVGGTWTLNLPTCGNPSQNSPYSGTYTAPPTKLPLVVTWTNPTSACVLHYTADGSAPTASSPTYPIGGLSISSTTTIRVIAAATGYNSSTIEGGKWTIN
jgi:hypothetical protein